MTTRPPFDPVAFVFGVLFVAIAVVGLLDTPQLRNLNLAQFGAVVFIAAGAALLLSTTRSRRDDTAPADTP